MYYLYHWYVAKYIKIVLKLKGKTPQGSFRRKLDDDIKLNLKMYVVCELVYSFNLIDDRVHCGL